MNRNNQLSARGSTKDGQRLTLQAASTRVLKSRASLVFPKRVERDVELSRLCQSYESLKTQRGRDFGRHLYPQLVDPFLSEGKHSHKALVARYEQWKEDVSSSEKVSVRPREL